jgi:hypothetical protein
MNDKTLRLMPRAVPRMIRALPEPDELRVLRVVREALREEPPILKFVPRDLRLPQL